MRIDQQIPTHLILGDELSQGGWIVSKTPMINPSNEVTTLDTATLEAWRYEPGLTAIQAIKTWSLGMELDEYGLPGFYLTSVVIKRIVQDIQCGVDTLIGVTLTALGMVQDKPPRKSYSPGIVHTGPYTRYEVADQLAYKIEGIVPDGQSLPDDRPTRMPVNYPDEFMSGMLPGGGLITYDPPPQVYPVRPSGWVMTGEETRKIDYTPWTLAARNYEFIYPYSIGS